MPGCIVNPINTNTRINLYFNSFIFVFFHWRIKGLRIKTVMMTQEIKGRKANIANLTKTGLWSPPNVSIKQSIAKLFLSEGTT